MQAGQYFNKRKLLSEKIQDLLDQISLADPTNINTNEVIGIPETIYIKKPQVYQEYYHLSCKQINFYENYYKSSAKISNKTIEKIELKQEQSLFYNNKQNQKQIVKQSSNNKG
eukprot:882877_1